MPELKFPAAAAGLTVTADPASAAEARSIRKVYPGGTVAVDSLDLAVRPGEVFGLLGPNGAGKSTTVGIFTTQVLPTAGRAWVAGVDVVAQPAVARQYMGIAPQRNTLDRSLTVRENLVFHGRFFGMTAGHARREADATLARVALTGVAGKPVQSLSGGMAQRLMIARAVMHRPAVLFLDEPTAGLDPQSRISLHDLVGDLQAAGQTIVLVTHDMDEADRLSDRVAIIDHGALVALGTPAELKRSLDADTVVTVEADLESAQLAGQLKLAVPGARDARVLHGQVMLTVHGNRGVFAAVVAAAEREHIVLRDVQVREPTLEAVFIRLTGKDLRS